MSEVVLDADSTTLVLNGTALPDFVAGDIITATPVNPLTSHVNSSNGGVTINKRTDGDVYDVAFTLQKFSASDLFMQSQVNQSSPVVFNGSMKEDYTRDTTAGVETWILESGSITTQPTDTKNNTDGNANRQYTIRFRNVRRNL